MECCDIIHERPKSDDEKKSTGSDKIKITKWGFSTLQTSHRTHAALPMSKTNSQSRTQSDMASYSSNARQSMCMCTLRYSSAADRDAGCAHAGVHAKACASPRLSHTRASKSCPNRHSTRGWDHVRTWRQVTSEARGRAQPRGYDRTLRRRLGGRRWRKAQRGCVGAGVDAGGETGSGFGTSVEV